MTNINNIDNIATEFARALLNWRSLRWKIAALVAVASIAVALAVGVLVHRTTLDRSMNQSRNDARAELHLVLVQYERTGRIDTMSQELVEKAPPALLRPLRSVDGTYDSTGATTWYDDRKQGITWMWAAMVIDGQPVVTRIDAHADLLSRRALDRHIWYASLATLLVVVPLAALAAELPNRRLRRVARTARRIADGDLDARTRQHGRAGDEITEISATVDSMADSLRDRLRAEQRFTADVAHELRTPLMGLVTSAELLPESEATDLVRDRVLVLRHLVEDLLEISRLDAGAERADLRPVALGDLVKDSLARAGLPVRLTVADGSLAETDPRRLDRIVVNLVSNAHRHGRGPVEVVVDGTTIAVRDHGPGFPDDLLAVGPQRFWTGATERGRGHGLGLTIAVGQARVIGATLAFANAVDGGAIATLRLPATNGYQD
jgi:signal transduction histidine kinase